MSVVKNLRYNWPCQDSLLNISQWEVPDQGISSLTAPSGSGKSTLIRCLLGLERACSGQWLFKGQDLMALSVAQRNLGVVFQGLELFPHLTAKENILFSAKARGLGARQAKEKIEHLAEVLKIQNCLKQNAKEISGGEAQRVAIARAIIGAPQFLFLDEAFSSLDDSIKTESRRLVRSTIDEFKIPCLLVTHDKNDINELSDHQFILQAGQVYQV